MDDLFHEILIKKRMTAVNKFLRIFPVVLTVLIALAGVIIHPIFYPVALVMLGVDYFLVPMQYVEYEYSYVSGSLDIDKIYNKAKRKKGDSFSVSEFEIMAPYHSDRLTDYKRNSQLQVVDYTSGDPEDPAEVFAFVLSKNGSRRMVLFQPDEMIQKDLRMRAPSKVFLH